MTRKGLYRPEYEHDACGVGLLLNVKGSASHDIVENALRVLENMVHRGAERPDATGDGAGIQIQIPHSFIMESCGLDLKPGEYGVGSVFLPKDEALQTPFVELIEMGASLQGLQIAAVRDVPTDASVLGADARRTEPCIRQFVITAQDPDSLELRLYLMRKYVERSAAGLPGAGDFYIASLSSRTLIYKGMLSSGQLRLYFPDLMHPHLESAIALVHSRFSTNTFPTWSLAQPFRYIAHNGEINTIRGNRRWMEARESVLQPKNFSIDDVRPVLEKGMSDSASLDNVLEFFVMAGMSLPHALAMLIPESFNKKNPISPALKAFYEYHSILMEAWDGPATLLFTDGRYAGGMLDRNGLRPARYVLTTNGNLIIASECGVLGIDDHSIREKGRLSPGKMLMVDTLKGEILSDKSIKDQLAREFPYGDWLALNKINLKDVSSGRKVSQNVEDYDFKLRAFGYQKSDISSILLPMVQTSQEPSVSMGNDTPLAAFSRQPQLLFNYFRQQFAQVTNPPIDPIREELVMDVSTYIGQISHNLLDPDPQLCKMVQSNNPIITNREIDLLRNLSYKGFRTKDLDLCYDGCSLEQAVEKICAQAAESVAAGYNYLILTDKALRPGQTAVPSLLATSALHNYLIERRLRVQTAILVEAGDVREVMHFALLMGYGASAVCPYMAMSIIDGLCRDKTVQLDFPTAEKHYITAVNKGLKKIISKMGIATLGSYKGAGLFEAVGLDKEFLQKYFSGTPSPFSAVGIDRIESDLKRFAEEETIDNRAEIHAWTPQMIKLLQQAVAADDYSLYKEFAKLSDERQDPIFIRDLLDYKPLGDAAQACGDPFCHRLVAGAISFGAIGIEAHEAIARAMNAVGGRSNTGEGGEDPARFGTDSNSRIKQVASGRFGVNAHYLVNADEIQIKVAQGAKPGEGGQLPGFKVNEVIAKTRHSIPGITLISPPPHHDIYSIEDLAELVYDLKSINPGAKVSVKLVSESGVGTIAAGVAKAKADIIVISGGCGGTGASPASSVRHAGMPAESGLAEAHQTLVINGMRQNVTLQVDGQIKTGRDIIIMALLGAQEFAISTGFMIALGCKLCRQCHTNKCPAGIATQDPEKRAKFCGKPEYIERYCRFLERDVQERLAAMGAAGLDDIIGRSDLLECLDGSFDFSDLLAGCASADHCGAPAHLPEVMSLNSIIVRECSAAVQNSIPVRFSHHIKNTDRAVGAGVAGLVASRYGAEGMPEGSIHVDFKGSAGQSFGAFLTGGVEFRLEGDANDYVGKSLSGGRIVIVPPAGSIYDPRHNIIAGNTLLYGATSGELYACGRVGERFAVRNSGAVAVVEGVGDHACEYMTGGRVVVLGTTGRNFAAGMSGGIAYVWNEKYDFDFFCNMEHVELTLVEDPSDEEELLGMLRKHKELTGSPLAAEMLSDWESYRRQFIKVLPVEYKQVLLKGE